MERCFFKLNIFLITLAALAFSSRAFAGWFDSDCFYLPIPCAEGEKLSDAPPPPAPAGTPYTEAQLATGTRTACNQDFVDISEMGFNQEACSDAIIACEAAHSACMKSACTKSGDTWYCTQAHINSCSHFWTDHKVSEICKPLWLDAGPALTPEQQALADIAALSPEEQQQLRDLAALAALSPEDQQLLRDLAALAALSPEEQQLLRDLAALAALTPEQQQQLRDLAALAALTPEQQQQLRDLAALATLSPEEQQKLRDYASALNKERNAGGEVTQDAIHADSAASGGGSCTLSTTQTFATGWYLLLGLVPGIGLRWRRKK